jgi:hypothetical protein
MGRLSEMFPSRFTPMTHLRMYPSNSINTFLFSPYLDCPLIYQIRNSIATFYLLQMWQACWNRLSRLLMNSSKFIAQSTLTKINANKIMYSSDMALEGFTAYDSHIAKLVLVHLVVLCFLADSPTHAKVTNTPKPGQSNHSCRMCTVS